MKRNLWAAFAGFLFGTGLVISQMVDRVRVIGFLDILGDWDPTLLFVMLGAVSVTLVLFKPILKWSSPLMVDNFALPKSSKVTSSLIVGALLFGVGWGLSGYCPGPGLAALAWRLKEAVVVLTGFMLGSLCHGWLVYLRRGKQVASKR